MTAALHRSIFAALGLALSLDASVNAQTPNDIAVEILFRSITPVDGVKPPDNPSPAPLPPGQRRVVKWDHTPLKLFISLEPSDPADPTPLKILLASYFKDVSAETKLSVSYVEQSDQADIWINYKRAAGLAAYVKRIEGLDGVVCFGSLFYRDNLPGEKAAPNWGVIAVPSDLGDAVGEACLSETMTKLLGYSRQPREAYGFDQASLEAIKPVGDFDRMVLGILYAPAVKAGMTKDETIKAIAIK